VVSEFAPKYPLQIPGHAFGIAGSRSVRQLLGPGSRMRFWVPENGRLGTNWIAPRFDDSSWHRGLNGLGYEATPDIFAPFLKTDVLELMYERAPSCYIRLPFLVSNLGDVAQTALRVQFDDGFVAWLNGVEVARSNAPPVLRWNSEATANRRDSRAI